MTPNHENREKPRFPLPVVIMKHILSHFCALTRTVILVFAMTQANVAAMHAQDISFHNEAADTTRITDILIEQAKGTRPSDVSAIALLFTGTPYESGTLEGDSIETLRVNLDAFDCTTFVETALALAMTVNENRQSWRDFVYNLRSIRYRGGETDGYPSRLHYVSDWILDNVSRGNFKEVTDYADDARHCVKSLDYMTAHREAYPALADAGNYERMKNIEAGYSNHRYPYLKGNALKEKKLGSLIRNGDVICFTTSTKGLDVTHMGVALIKDGIIHLLHASSKAGEVIIDPLPLTDYVRRNRNEGIRVIRLATD